MFEVTLNKSNIIIIEVGEFESICVKCLSVSKGRGGIVYQHRCIIVHVNK